MDRERVRTAMREIAWKHIPSNARQWTWLGVDEQGGTNSLLGTKADYPPIEGKVVDRIDGATVVKKARTEFAVVADTIMPSIPDIGATVRITPYARRLFDGTRLDAPKVEEHTRPDGTKYTTRILRIGDQRTPLPVTAAHSSYLKDLIAQIEERRAPDGFRTVAQLLVDASARYFTVEDPDDDADIMATKPMLSFWVDTAQFKGRVSITYWRVPDYYQIRFEPADGGLHDEQDVDFTSVGQVLHDRIDDGAWRMAAVEILKPAPRRRAATAVPAVAELAI